MSFSSSSHIGANSPTLADSRGAGSSAAVLQMGEALSERADTRERRGVAETSREAFHSLPVADYLQPKERAILALFTGPGVRLSRQQIAERVPMALCGVCGRVSSLLAKGALEEAGDTRDPATGKRQKLLQLPREAQGSLLEVHA